VIFTLAFSPDGGLLAVGGNQGWAVFDTSAFGQQLFRRGDQVHSLAFSPDSRQLFIASEAVGLVRVWDLAANREAAELQHPGGPFAVALSPDGGTLYAASPQSLRSWKLRGPAEKLTLSGHHGGSPHVVFSPDGKQLASAGKDRTVKIWDPATGKLRKELTDFCGGVEALAFSPDGRLLAAADMGGTLRLWDVPSWEELPAPEHDLGLDLWSVAFSRDGTYFAASGGRGLRVWGVARGAGPEASGPLLPTPVFQQDGVITAVCFSPDSNRLAWVSRGQGDGDHRVSLCERPFRQARELPARLHFFVRALDFSPDGRRLTFVSDRRVLEVWDVLTGSKVDAFGSEELVSGYGGIALSADGVWVACGNLAVTVWDTDRRKLLLTLPAERSTVWALAWSPDRELLAVCSSDGGPVVWNVRAIRAQLGELGLDW
jgi:WD40 repeat protein